MQGSNQFDFLYSNM